MSVLRATGLSPPDDKTKADPFVKLTIPGVGVMHRTQVTVTWITHFVSRSMDGWMDGWIVGG